MSAWRAVPNSPECSSRVVPTESRLCCVWLRTRTWHGQGSCEAALTLACSPPNRPLQRIARNHLIVHGCVSSAVKVAGIAPAGRLPPSGSGAHHRQRPRPRGFGKRGEKIAEVKFRASHPVGPLPAWLRGLRAHGCARQTAAALRHALRCSCWFLSHQQSQACSPFTN